MRRRARTWLRRRARAGRRGGGRRGAARSHPPRHPRRGARRHRQPGLVAGGDVVEHPLQSAVLTSPPPLATEGVAAALHRAVVAAVGDVVVVAALEVRRPEGFVAFRPPARVRGLLRRQSFADLVDGVVELLAGRDGGHGDPTRAELPCRLAAGGAGDAHVRRARVARLVQRPRLLLAEVAADPAVVGGGVVRHCALARRKWGEWEAEAAREERRVWGRTARARWII